MKIIDQTPFYDATGKLSLGNRLKAFLRFGKSWESEMEAQKSVQVVLEKVLDRGFTLLRNVTPPGLDIPIPFILVGPTGVYVIYVTPMIGMIRAKGDQWGTISGNAFKPEKQNLLTRTESMARAVQLYLQRQGFNEMLNAEPVLLCSNPGIHVDSLRPIVRIVMRDAVERFAYSVRDARVALSPESVTDIINFLLNPPTPREETPAPATELAPTGDQKYALPEAYGSAFSTQEEGSPQEALPVFLSEDGSPLANPARRKGFSLKQWLLLAAMLLVWCLVMAVFLFLVFKDLVL